jgi:hypothetical protein
MIARILLVAAVAFALMFVVKDGSLLRDAGLLSSCRTMPVPSGAVGNWQVCSKGRLDGQRDLSDTCAWMGARGSLEYWSCPLESNRQAAPASLR